MTSSLKKLRELKEIDEAINGFLLAPDDVCDAVIRNEKPRDMDNKTWRFLRKSYMDVTRRMYVFSKRDSFWK